MSGVKSVTGADFDRDIGSSSGLVLLDLWAPWCGPCRGLAPVIEDLADDFADTIAFRKADIDAETGIADRLSVKAVPTLILFRDGRQVDRKVGAASRARLSAWLESHL